VALEVIEDIRSAEKQARELIERARLEGEKALQAARARKEKDSEQAHQRAEKLVTDRVSQSAGQAQGRIEELKGTNAKELLALKKRAGKNQKKAVDLVLQSLI